MTASLVTSIKSIMNHEPSRLGSDKNDIFFASFFDLECLKINPFPQSKAEIPIKAGVIWVLDILKKTYIYIYVLRYICNTYIYICSVYTIYL